MNIYNDSKHLLKSLQIKGNNDEVPDDIDPLLKQVTEETLANIDQVGFWPVTHLAPALFRQMNQFIQGMVGGQLTPAQVLEKMQDAHETYKREKGIS